MFAGMQYDATTGLYYDHARYYDAVIGRFMSQDPKGFAAGDTNLYRYVGNDPTGLNDPSGMIYADDDFPNGPDAFAPPEEPPLPMPPLPSKNLPGPIGPPYDPKVQPAGGNERHGGPLSPEGSVSVGSPIESPITTEPNVPQGPPPGYTGPPTSTGAPQKGVGFLCHLETATRPLCAVQRRLTLLHLILTLVHLQVSLESSVTSCGGLVGEDKTSRVHSDCRYTSETG